MTDSTRFAKVLKTPEVIALAFGAMIGWSWVLLTGVWLTAAGTIGTLIAFCVGGLAVTLIGLTYSELAAAMPKAGGEHIYTQRALGSRWSFVCTWALLFSYVNVCMFEAVALSSRIFISRHSSWYIMECVRQRRGPRFYSHRDWSHRLSHLG